MWTYKRKIGARPYITEYSAATLSKVVIHVKRHDLSARKVSQKYGIPLGTINNRVSGGHGSRVGAPTRLSAATESRLVETITTLATWKVPLGHLDVRLLVKDYLDRSGVSDARFADNCPGPDWMNNFVKRHNLTAWLAYNVKPTHAETTTDIVKQYFDELEKSTANIPQSHIYNYDETNITDDPRSKTIICKRGLKRVERKIQHSRTAISLMYCISADGRYLPLMVVYKAQNVYTEWTKGGPPGAIYDATPSRWFDWEARVVTGDNLEGHALRVKELFNHKH